MSDTIFKLKRMDAALFLKVSEALMPLNHMWETGKTQDAKFWTSAFDSVGQGGDQESAFLRVSSVMRLPLFTVYTLNTTALGRTHC